MLTWNLSPSAVCPLFRQEINKAPSIIEIQIIYQRHVPLRKQGNKSQLLYPPLAQSLLSGTEYKTAYTTVFDVRNFILYSPPNSPRFDFLDPYVFETFSFTPRGSREQEYPVFQNTMPWVIDGPACTRGSSNVYWSGMDGCKHKEGWIGRAQMIFTAVRIFCMILNSRYMSLQICPNLWNAQH